MALLQATARAGLLLVLSGLLLSYGLASAEGGPPLAPINRPLDAHRAKQQVLTQLQSRLEAGDRVRVLVQLDIPFAPEGSGLGRAAVNAQRSSIAQAQAVLSERLTALNSRTLWRFKFAPLMLVEVDNAGLADLVANPNVSSIEEDVPVPPTLLESAPLIGADQAWLAGYTGSGQTVAILDTGVDSVHAFFEGRVVDEACFSTTGGGSTTLCPNGLNEQLGTGAGVNCSTSITGCDHGTHVAGIAAGDRPEFSGVAPDAQIVAMQVFSRFDDEAYCGVGNTPCVLSWTTDQIRALEWVYEQRLTYSFASANMSLGGGQYISPCDTDSRKLPIDNLRSAGIATVISTGNSGFKDSLSKPACISTAISVGASTDIDNVASFSNVSDFMSLLAPGSVIYSSIPGNLFGTMSGTSMSAPHVTGAWAVLKSKVPSASVDEVLTALRSTGLLIDDTRSGGVVTDMPRIQLDAASDALAAATPTPTSSETLTPTPSPTTAVTATPTATVLPTATATATPTPTDGPSPTPTATACEYEYSITELGTLGGTWAEARDINDAGQVVGRSTNAYGEWRAFLWDDGVMIDLGTLGGQLGSASAINDLGQIVGSAQTAAGATHAVFWDEGVMLDLGTLGGSNSGAAGINNAGQIVGQSDTADGYYHAFLWDSGVMTDLGTLGGRWSLARAVNDFGQIVGESETDPIEGYEWGAWHAFSYAAGVMQDLGTFGGWDSYASDVNGGGEIVGFASDPDEFWHAYHYEDGVMVDLCPLCFGESLARGINAAGQIIGVDDDGVVIWQDAEATSLTGRIAGVAGWSLNNPWAINNLGSIIGFGWLNGQWRSFLLTPGGCLTPTETPTPVPSAQPSSTPTPTPSAAAPPSDTPTSTSSPTAISTHTPSPTATPNLAGDLNGDGAVNVLDVQLCVNVVLGLETDPLIVARADVNGDSLVNVLDVQIVVNAFLGG